MRARRRPETDAWAVATVSAYFGGDGGPDAAAAEQIADRLLAAPAVITVRVSARGFPAVYRVDVARAGPSQMTAAALAPGHAVASSLGLRLVVVAVDVVDATATAPSLGAGENRG